ncbi:hypothetical protein BGZ82_005304 [Podila clonocystis]|nr:hypothetical protein BGZ82_005304 [Podila clonocystis]
MFKGGFVEGVKRAKRNRIKEAKPAAFQALVSFLHFGRLPPCVQSMTVCVAELKDEKEVSPEELFLAGHGGQHSTVVADSFIARCFQLHHILFRSLYLSQELRELAINLIVKTCGNQIAKRPISDSYKEHPDHAHIIGSLNDDRRGIARPPML